MMGRRRVLGVAALLCVAGLAACVQEEPAAPVQVAAGQSDELIYGADDRQEWYELATSREQQLANATSGLFQSTQVSAQPGGSYLLDTSRSFGAAYGLCSSEPYRDQPSSAFCSGFLVGDDLMVTAGHCVDAASCATTTFVFGFHMQDASTVRAQVPAQDVYTCAQVIARTETSTDDFAVVRLDRPVSGHQPLELRRSGTIATGQPLIVAGHPAGLPLKVAGGAQVRDNSHPYYFSSNLDTYGGNSGSPVINASNGQVEGILVRGNTDFVLAGKGRNRCYVSNECSDGGCPGWEDVTRTSRFVAYVPEPNPCTADAQCDDGDICNGAEVCNLGTGACEAGTALVCNDGDACTADSCDPQAGCSSSAITCDDGDACTVEFCDSVDGCGSEPVACDNGADGCCSPGCEGVDPDCDGPACALRDEACSSNADCCSGSCHSRKGTCR